MVGNRFYRYIPSGSLCNNRLSLWTSIRFKLDLQQGKRPETRLQPKQATKLGILRIIPHQPLSTQPFEFNCEPETRLLSKKGCIIGYN
ncbi:protein of unknown function [Acidithiobacillus ferrivorans]|uniref:Uncharacterized protein n=1 Tax=Acidithiobacillus ferrivorans TaxID=160808 RepID=A0A060URW8_9PROT|nr:hypothetical protein AFERRI_490002 [Acidithiobacillus ferrivorans]SMH66051.1 protein of unknown function [Acidithiobacillus ferrivorans]